MGKNKFIRFGGLSPVIQTHYQTGEEKTFHNPPRRRGIYAFPFPYIERFLLGATDEPGNISNKSQWLRDENGNKIIYEDFYLGTYNEKSLMRDINPKYINLLKKLNIKRSDISAATDKKDDKNYITFLKKPKVFEYDGEIWHHLGDYLKPHQIIATSGSWTKSDMDNYNYAFTMDVRAAKRDMLKTAKEFSGFSDFMKKNPYKSWFSKDHLEVFIEKL
jgi:hypothetical protein